MPRCLAEFISTLGTLSLCLLPTRASVDPRASFDFLRSGMWYGENTEASKAHLTTPGLGFLICGIGE